MKKIFKENILDEALIWLDSKLTVILATVISTWGSSPRPVSSQMIINNKNKFSGSISGGCVEANVINEASKMIKEKKLCKKLEFLVSNDKAWKIGLACGGKITVLLEKVNLEKKKVLEKIVKKERKKNSFSVITNIKSGYSCIFEKSNELEGDFKKYYKKINLYFHKNKNGLIKNTDIFIKNYHRPIKVIIIGAVHIAQHLINFTKNLDFELIVIDPRNFFSSNKKYFDVKIINEWPKKAFNKIKVDENCALITLTHDPKIDDPAIEYALNNNFFYVGSLGSKKTHKKRCLRLKKAGFANYKIKKIKGPIGLKLGGRSTPEIALSIISQLVYETYKKSKIN